MSLKVLSFNLVMSQRFLNRVDIEASANIGVQLKKNNDTILRSMDEIENLELDSVLSPLIHCIHLDEMIRWHGGLGSSV